MPYKHFDSTEFARNFVVACYRSILGREPDEYGMAAHMASLESPSDYIELIQTFCESEEFRARVFSRQGKQQQSDVKHYFVHIHKTGGTTIHNWLLYKAAPGRVFPGFFVNDLIRNKNALDSLDYFSGHFSNKLDVFLNIRTRKATLLRNPVDRVISQFCHIQRDSSHALHPILGHLSLEDVMESDRYRSLMGNNLQAKALTEVTTTDDEPLKKAQLNFLSEEELYSVAEKSVREMELVGVLDFIQEFACSLSTLWKLPSPGQLVPVNVGVNRNDDEFDAILRRQIWQYNRVDDQLYREAKALWR